MTPAGMGVFCWKAISDTTDDSISACSTTTQYVEKFIGCKEILRGTILRAGFREIYWKMEQKLMLVKLSHETYVECGSEWPTGLLLRKARQPLGHMF